MIKSCKIKLKMIQVIEDSKPYIYLPGDGDGN